MSLMLSIAAAIAPHTVFGIAIGQPLTMPECKKAGRIAEAPNIDFGYEPRQPVTCHEAGRINPGETWATETIRFPIESMPTITRSGSLDVMIVGGNVIGFSIPTAGVESQDIVLSELTEKFGKPDSLRREPVQNIAGATFQSITALWAPHGLAVSFNATLYRIDMGEVTIDTPEALAMRSEALKKATATHTPL